MKIVVVIVLAALAIAGYVYLQRQDDASPYYDNCTAFLEAALKAPGSLVLVSSHETEWQNDIKTVSLTYDAQNSFGALLRGHFSCSYLPNVGWWEGDISPNNDLRDPERSVDSFLLTPFELSVDGEKIGGSRTEKNDDISLLQLKAFSIMGQRDREG